MAGLETVASLATAGAVLIAIVFGVIQMRQQERKRRDAAAMEMMRSMLTPEFIEAFPRFTSLAEGEAGLAAMKADPLLQRSFFHAAFVAESLGVLVFRGVLPLHMVDDLMGGFFRTLWRKSRLFVDEQRRLVGHNNYFEWGQWLAERLAENPVKGKADGAHVYHSSWRPPAAG